MLGEDAGGEEGDGERGIAARGLVEVEAGVGEGSTVAARISSETVTNLNPFASSASKVEGMASIVPG